jgi:hypothetical protein
MSVMVFNVTFNNISVASWPSVLLVEETGVSGENHRPAASHWKLNHVMLYHTGIYTDYNKAYNILRVPDIFLLQTKLFSSECTTGRYGVNCDSHCLTCVNRICSRHDGSCKYGCIEGFKGEGCHSLGIHIFTNINTKNTNIDML